jgi:hypothetical protein
MISEAFLCPPSPLGNGVSTSARGGIGVCFNDGGFGRAGGLLHLKWRLNIVKRRERGRGQKGREDKEREKRRQ